MHSLALTLGHNSSAIYIRDGQVIAGYEEERFSQVKSDSRFPISSISELRKRFFLPDDISIFVGHWFTDAQLPQKNKYWDPDVIKSWFPDCTVDALSADFTHHDSHLESAMVFAGPEFGGGSYHAIVADGFGNFGECLSIYEVTGKSYRLIKRVFGFEKSMGMLYQYATAFMGMKMHNHEYKMLAYEVHITEVLTPSDIRILRSMAVDTAQTYLKLMHTDNLSSDCDPVTKIDALPNVQARINAILTGVLTEFSEKDSEYQRRVIVSYFVQKVVETVISTTVSMYAPHDLLVVGGLFYNVKLNHILANQVTGQLCAMPLAGDQGAGLGVYQAYVGDLVWPGHLFWGHRDLSFNEDDLPVGLVVRREAEAMDLIKTELYQKGFVNVVRGAMEYGPRALCNTSTIAVPTKEAAVSINRMNDRTMEMPFAPVVTREQADQIFLSCEKVHKSLEYMICTRTYKPGEGADFPGAAHYYPEEGVYTGRPQVTSDPMMVHLLNRWGPLVNTSFNYHGVPIVNTEQQILDTHLREWAKAPELQPTTVIIKE